MFKFKKFFKLKKVLFFFKRLVILDVNRCCLGRLMVKGN